MTLSAVLELCIFSFTPSLQSTFISELTLEIVGREVAADARLIAVMWSTKADVPARGEVDISHIVTLQRCALTVPPCTEEAAR